MSRTLRLASKLLGTSVLAQVAVLGAIAVAAARTTPADFALFGSVSAAAAILASCNTLAAESRSPVVADDASFALVRAGATIATLVMLVCLLAGGVAALAGLSWGVIAALAGVCAWLLAAQQLMTGMVMRLQRQELLARNRLFQGLGNAVLILALIALPIPSYLALVGAWALSLLIGDLVIWAGLPGEVRSRALRPASASDARTLVRQVRWQPVANLMATTAAQLPVLALQVSGSGAIAGAWALANRFLLPVVNTGNNTLQPIYYGHAAALLRESRMAAFGSYHRTWMLRLAAAGLAALAGFGVVVWWVIPALGAEWDVARVVIVPACLHFATMLACLPLSQTLILLGRVDMQFVWTTVRFVACAAPLAAIGVIGALPALVTWSVASSLTFVWQLALHCRALRSEAA